MKTALIIGIFMILNSYIHAQIHTEYIDYKDGDVQLQGYLAYDESKQDQRPGILVVHEWWGLNDYPKERAEQLAKLGYVAFAVDMYGKGVVAKTPGEAGKLAGSVRGNPELMRSRANAGLEILKKNKFVNTEKLAAIGYCFGGSVVLEMARSGADIGGVAAFHAGFGSGKLQAVENFKGEVLILHGAEDKASTVEQALTFTKALDEAGVSWQMEIYSDAVHAFTNPNAGNDPSKGSAYNKKAAERSWETMKMFFNEIFQ